MDYLSSSYLLWPRLPIEMYPAVMGLARRSHRRPRRHRNRALVPQSLLQSVSRDRLPFLDL